MSANGKINESGVYIVHGIHGYESREKMLNELLHDQYGIDFDFVTESHNNSENEVWIKQYFIDNVKSVLRKGPLFCTLVHILIYERFIKSNNKYAIIFENDVCFLGQFLDKINLIVNEANQLDAGFMISLENSTLKFPSWRKIQKGRYLYPADAGRCAGAYLIDQKAAKLMLDDLKENRCGDVIDWWHNKLIERKTIKIYWAHPPLTEQGSFNGKLPSTISNRADGLFRIFKWQLQKFYKMYIIRWFK